MAVTHSACHCALTQEMAASDESRRGFPGNQFCAPSLRGIPVGDKESRQKTLNKTRETERFPVLKPAPLLWQFLLGTSVNLYLLALCNPVIDYRQWRLEPLAPMFMTLPQLLQFIFPWWANPLLPASWISGCYGRRRIAVIFGGRSWLMGILLYVSLSADVHPNGYLFWMGSITFAVLAGISLPRTQ